MPRNKGKNGFYHFMIDWKKRAEAAGRSFPNGLKDVQSDPECSAEWQKLTPEKKGQYHSRAKDSRIAAMGRLDKKTTYGESVRVLEELERKRQEFEQTMQDYIEHTISIGSHHKNLHTLRFVFMHVNWFCVKEYAYNETDYFPAEFAVAKFSLKNGIEDVYHEIINCKVPLGYLGQARDRSIQTHQIPIEMPEGRKDFDVMYGELVKFLQSEKIPGNKFPPVFTLKENANAVRSMLNRMTRANDGTDDIFLVYSLETLFGTLLNATAKTANISSIPLVVAEKEFQKDVFCYTPHLECDFHKYIDSASQYCSMSIVKRWGFIICDHCCQYVDVAMIPGIHCPAKIDVTDMQNLTSMLDGLNVISTKNEFLSMTGVSEEYRMRKSERTSREEQRRRNESKAVEIIDHGKLNNSTTTASTAKNTSSAPVCGRPLRTPKTISYAMIGAESDRRPEINDTNFPMIGGRGMFLKKKTENTKPSVGRGSSLPG